MSNPVDVAALGQTRQSQAVIANIIRYMRAMPKPPKQLTLSSADYATLVDAAKAATKRTPGLLFYGTTMLVKA